MIAKEIKKHRILQKHNTFNEQPNRCALSKDCQCIFAVMNYSVKESVSVVLNATTYARISFPTAITALLQIKPLSSAMVAKRKLDAVLINTIIVPLPHRSDTKQSLLNQEPV